MCLSRRILDLNLWYLWRLWIDDTAIYSFQILFYNNNQAQHSFLINNIFYLASDSKCVLLFHIRALHMDITLCKYSRLSCSQVAKLKQGAMQINVTKCLKSSCEFENEVEWARFNNFLIFIFYFDEDCLE